MGSGFCPRSQNPAVVSTSDDDGDVLLQTKREKLFQGYLVEQRVAASEEKTVEIGVFRKIAKHLGLVHTDAHCADDLLASEFIQGGIGLVERLPVGIVD